VTIRQAFHFTLRKIWLLAAILLVTAAVLLSAVRFSLPYLDHYRADIEQLLSDYYDQDIQVGSLNAAWTGSGPALVLEDLALEQSRDLPIAVQVERVSLILSFWSSIYQRQPVFDDFVLHGLDLTLDVSARGETSDIPVVTALESLLLNQLERFQVRESMLRLQFGDGQERSLQIESLSWFSSNGRKQASGQLRVPGLTANHLNFLLDFEGSSFSAMTGSVYLEAERLDISPWVEEITSTATITRAEFNLQGWLDINDGHFGDGQLHLAENFLNWERQGESHELITSETVWAIQPQEEGWLMNSQPLEVRIDDEVWPVERVIWQYLRGEHTMNLRDVQLPDVTPLWSLLGNPGEEIRTWFEGIQPQGLVSELRLRMNTERNISAYLLADQMRWNAYRGIPGINALQVELWTTQQGGQFQVKGNEVTLSSPNTFADSQKLQSIEWEGYWERASDGWEVALSGAEIALPDARIIQDFRLSGYQGRSPSLEWSIQTADSGLDVFRVVSLLPLQMDENLSNYLHNALQGGELEYLTMLWRGPLDDFPYQANEGVFQARAEIENLDFKFRPEWPALRARKAVLQFAGDELTIDTADGRMMDVDVEQAYARFPSMFEPQRELIVDAKVTGLTHAVRELFDNSPLASSVAGTLEQVRPVGRISGEFRLDIPLYEGGDVIAEGKAFIRNQDIQITSIDTRFSEVTGDLNFRNAQISFTSETARLYGMPVDIDVSGNSVSETSGSESNSGQSYALHANVAGDWSAGELKELHPDLLLSDWVGGAFNWQSEFELGLRDAGGFAYRWEMNADLSELTSGLPAPLQKTAGDEWTLSAVLRGNEQALTLRTEIPQRLQFRGDLTLGESGFGAVDFFIGEDASDLPQSPAPGNQLLFDLDHAVVSEWIPVIQHLYRQFSTTDEPFVAPELAVDSPERQTAGFMPALSKVSGRLLAANWLGQDLSDIRISGEAEDVGWQYTVDADQTRMRVFHRNDGSLAIRADYLNLMNFPEAEDAEQAADAERRWLDDLPPVSFTCQICRYSGKDLGEIHLELIPEQEYAQIQEFRVQKGRSQINFTGGWSHVNGPVSTRIQGDFSSDDIGALMHDFEVNSVVRDSSANVSFDLSWAGYMTDFNTETLSGGVNWRLGSGYLRDVNDGGARLFSVLSLESLVRKLTLDFRDVFARGMFFSSFRGDMQLVNGVVSTDNTRMNGSAGDLEVVGTTNLVDESLNYQLTYIPKVTSSLPVILAWMVNPPSGLAALLIDRVLHDAQVISRLQYQITGTMSEPEVAEVRRDSREVELPDEISEEELEQLPPVLPEYEPVTVPRKNEQGGTGND